ncbi:MAG: MATE family efflux transporter, partial [Oscillospiraceae bacterium]|nr:MATE family efflux transporter [Oscillospiraceae bacterium]
LGLITLPLSAIGSMLFQSIGKKGRAMLLALLQSGGVFIPLLLILPRFFGLTGLELAHPVAYAVAGFLSIPFALVFLNSLKNKDGTELSH